MLSHGAGLAWMMVKRPETRMCEQVNDKVVAGWKQLPKGFAHCDVAGVAGRSGGPCLTLSLSRREPGDCQ